MCIFVKKSSQMIKKICLPLFLFLSLNLFSQEISISDFRKMSDVELLNNISKYQSQGFDIETMLQIARSKGASENEIAEIQKRISSLSSKAPQNKTPDVVVSKTDFGKTTTVELNSTNIFGASFFSNANLTTNPSINIATPKDYILGPGDQITISLFGASNTTYEKTINKEGVVYIENISPLYLSGKSIAQATNFITNKLSPIYAGLSYSDNQKGKISLDLNLDKARSIFVSIVGQAKAPGNYTLNGFVSPINALYAAGGINELGSYRNIKIIRNNKVLTTLDLYDFFIEGKTPTISLTDQDIIVVPYSQKKVTLTSGFKKTGVFEMKEGETLSDLINFSGGLLPNANSKNISLVSFDNGNLKQSSVTSNDFRSYTPKDGDKISSGFFDDYLTNSITISGAVNIPGSFNFSEIKSINDLIEKANGLRKDALLTTANLFRRQNGKEELINKLSLQNILNGTQKVSLQEGDRINILSITDLEPEKTITILGSGSLANGEYSYYEGITIEDAVNLYAELALDNSDMISVYRKSDNLTNEDTQLFELSLSNDLSFKLMPSDQIIFRNKYYSSTRSISISGPVKSSGSFILTRKLTLNKLIDLAGGFLDNANKEGIYIKRQIDLTDVELNSLENSKISNFNTIILSVDFLKAENIYLKENDQVIISEKDNSITIAGAVQSETSYSFNRKESIKLAIKKAGGFSQNASRKNSFVVYANKEIKGTKKFLFFNTYPKIKPGSTVVVPTKIETNKKISTQELLGITSGISTLGILIRTLLGF